ncbi:response regulator, partial [Pseudomonas sp. GW460-13]|uniref:response regulator n=1 Tax=Pseudomonas sp. GW460-13 TaxID=2070590 RepID=UPI000CC1FEDC
MRVLLVEDDAMIGDSVKLALRQEGFTVDWVRDGDAGLAAASTAQGGQACYDLILLDLGLPRRPGLDVLRSLRARGVPTPVLILTARDSWTEKVEGIDAGADDYLAKPFRMEELLARIRALIRRAH